MKKKLVIIVLLLFVFYSCSSRKEQISFSGTITNYESGKIYLSLITPYETILLDSAVVKDGKFDLILKGIQDSTPSFYRLSIDPLNVINTIARKGERLELRADARSLVKTYTITGGEDAQLSWELDRQLKLLIDTLDLLFLFYEENIDDDSSRMFVEQIYEELLEKHENYLKGFIAQHPRSLATITAFYQTYNRRRFISETENLELLKDICVKLKAFYPQSEDVLFLERRIENLTNLTKKEL